MSEDVGYKQVLTRKDLFGIAVGMIIGAGVMTLTGIGIDRTGRSVFISYLIATFFALFFAVPSILSSSIARFKGGNYTVSGDIYSNILYISYRWRECRSVFSVI